MAKLSDYTIQQVKAVSTIDLANTMGMRLKRSGTSYQMFCPNPSHGYEKTPDTYIRMRDGVFKCFGGGGCGCQGGDSITLYSWATFGGWDAKTHFLDAVLGVAEVMGIAVVYEGAEHSHKKNNKPKAIYTPPPRQHVEEVVAQEAHICDRVYRRFLELCPIYPEHASEWLGPKRQYTQEQVLNLGMRSVPNSFEEVKIAIDSLLREDYPLERVPGFTQRLRRGGEPSTARDWYWTINVRGKYFLPVRDELGHIVRMRVATSDPKRKYVWFSSAPNIDVETDPAKMTRGGAPSGAPINVVVPHNLLKVWEHGTEVTDIYNIEMVVVTEGEHKSNISANKLQMPVIGIPGVGNFKDVLPTVTRWGAKKIAIAYDMDALLAEDKVEGKNVRVFENLVAFAKQLLDKQGIEVVIWCWNTKDGKGLDDLLLAHKTPTEIDLRTREQRPVVVA